jgi:putative photosynthetic complex assembly protein
MSEIDSQTFPKGALIGAGLLLSFTVAAAGVARFERLHAPPAVSRLAALSTIDLNFADAADGSVVIRDSHAGRLVTTLQPGTNGFVRDVLRGLAHERLTRGLGSAPPFRLSDYGAGRLVLEDTATGRRIDLQAFGVDNRAAFQRLLPSRASRPQGAVA